MNDKELLNDLLTSAKSQCELFMHGTIEAATPQVKQTFHNVLNEALQIQAQIFQTMQQKGWYQLEQVPEQKIQQVLQKQMSS